MSSTQLHGVPWQWEQVETAASTLILFDSKTLSSVLMPELDGKNYFLEIKT